MCENTDKPILVLASANKGKIREIGEMLPEYQVVGYKEMGLDAEIEETGSTFYENALIKARAVSDALGLPALADDSGLCVNALGGAPGIYSARYAGDGDDKHNNALLLKNMENIKDREAKFVSALVLYFPGGKIISAQGETYGKILYECEGTGGFGYDPLFYSFDLNKSLGVATAEEKNSISHRYRALCALKEKLNEENNSRI